MEITLRKANAVQNSINEAIRSIKIGTSIELNEFQDVTAELQAANNLLLSNDTRRQKLLLALYNIRGLVGTANANSGIDLALAKAAFIDKRIAQLNEIAEAKAVTSITVLTGKLDKIRNRKEDSRASLYGMGESVETSVLTNSDIDGFKTVVTLAKKAKQRLQDELLELNVRTTIELSTESERVLQAEGLI